MRTSKLIATIVILTIAVNFGLWIWIYFSISKWLINLSSNLTGTGNIAVQILPETKKTVVEKKIKEEINITDLQNQITKAVQKLSKSVVSVVISKNLKVFIENPYDFFWGHIAEKKEKIWWWSWIIVTRDWYIITNKHVVQDPTADYTVITSDWNTYHVDKIWLDPVLDFAILKVVDNKWNPPLNLTPADIKPLIQSVKVWQFVIAIWNALAQYSNTATFGIISALGRQLNDLENHANSVYIWLYQTDAAINPWNSWGPLANINWQVIWVNTAISAIWQWIGFAIPLSSEFVETTLKTIKKYWKIVRPFIWIEFIDLNQSISKAKDLNQVEGALIKKVLPWTPAAKAGLQSWDIILKINWIDINLDHPLLYVVYTYMPGDTIQLLIDRNWKLIKKELTLDILKF